jgi:ribosomal protein L11 methyltransferase
MSSPLRRFPALDIHFASEADSACDLRDRLVAGLDDFQPTAIEETTKTWRVFFDSPEAREQAFAWMRGLGDPRVTADPLDVEDEDWARRSQADLRPVRVGRIVVSPPWCADTAREHARPNDILIVVVPSTGFGTGHHASTRLCLAFLQEIAVRGRTVLDVGTGSGLLAIAAARLGASAVTAVDNDRDALDAARENLGLNLVGVPFRLHAADFQALADAHADIVVANLTGELLRRTAADLLKCVRPRADLVLSGVLAEEQSRVVGAFKSAGATLRATKAEDEWVGLHFTVAASGISGRQPGSRVPA